MVLNIINGKFELVKSWQKSPRPIGVRALFVPFWSHCKPHTRAQLEWPKRLAQLDNELYIRRKTYRIWKKKWFFHKKVFIRDFHKGFHWDHIRNEMVCMWVLDTYYSLIGNRLRDHTSWVLSGIRSEEHTSELQSPC